MKSIFAIMTRISTTQLFVMTEYYNSVLTSTCFLFQSSKVESAEDIPVTPPLSNERLPHNFHSSSDSLDQHPIQSCHDYDTGGLVSTPKISSISGTKTSVDASARTSSSREVDHSGELSVSNASDMETEWVEQDEPGVYITIRSLPGGTRELRRVRFRYVKCIIMCF